MEDLYNGCGKFKVVIKITACFCCSLSIVTRVLRDTASNFKKPHFPHNQTLILITFWYQIRLLAFCVTSLALYLAITMLAANDAANFFAREVKCLLGRLLQEGNLG